MARYWEKLWHDILRDRKVGVLPDAMKWRFVSCVLLAGIQDENGFLPPMDEMAFELGVVQAQLELELPMLAKRELLELKPHPESGEDRWFVTNYTKRQSAVPDKDRKRYQRERDRNPKNIVSVSSSSSSNPFLKEKKDETEETEETEKCHVAVTNRDMIRNWLAEYGIKWNQTTSRLGECDWITPEYISAHVAGASSSGLAIRRMLDGDPPPPPLDHHQTKCGICGGSHSESECAWNGVVAR